jgi:hypothetical protein
VAAPGTHQTLLAEFRGTLPRKSIPAQRVGGFAAYFQKPLDLNDLCATRLSRQLQG